jgi:hypothetical protein
MNLFTLGACAQSVFIVSILCCCRQRLLELKSEDVDNFRFAVAKSCNALVTTIGAVADQCTIRNQQPDSARAKSCDNQGDCLLCCSFSPHLLWLFALAAAVELESQV